MTRERGREGESKHGALENSRDSEREEARERQGSEIGGGGARFAGSWAKEKDLLENKAVLFATAIDVRGTLGCRRDAAFDL